MSEAAREFPRAALKKWCWLRLSMLAEALDVGWGSRGQHNCNSIINQCTRRDSNPQPTESESVILSNWTTGAIFTNILLISSSVALQSKGSATGELRVLIFWIQNNSGLHWSVKTSKGRLLYFSAKVLISKIIESIACSLNTSIVGAKLSHI